MNAKSLFASTSTRAFPSPAATRSENSASSFTGSSTRDPNRRRHSTPVPRTSTTATSSSVAAGLGSAVKSNGAAPFDRAPAP